MKIDPNTGLDQPTRGLSVYCRPERVARFGGAFRVAILPSELRVVQRGRDLMHFEIVPARPMSPEDYEQALVQVVLILV